MKDMKDKRSWLLQDMTWCEVKKALELTDVALVPVGSTEQHSMHLPLGTDHHSALDLALSVAEEVKAVVVPASYVGVSPHHMGFPGTLTLQPDTLAQVLAEVGRCLARHGFRRLVLINTHGGNEATVRYAAERITRETEARALVFGVDDMRRLSVTFPDDLDKLDIHAGVRETSWMLHSHPGLVDMSVARKPTLNLGADRLGWLSRAKAEPGLLRFVTAGFPDFDRLSDTGAVTLLDPGDARAEIGRQNKERFTDALASLIREWRGRSSGER